MLCFPSIWCTLSFQLDELFIISWNRKRKLWSIMHTLFFKSFTNINCSVLTTQNCRNKNICSKIFSLRFFWMFKHPQIRNNCKALQNLSKSLVKRTVKKKKSFRKCPIQCIWISLPVLQLNMTFLENKSWRANIFCSSSSFLKTVLHYKQLKEAEYVLFKISTRKQV